jgi:amidase
MARTVEDVSLMLSAIAGPDPRSPISILESGDIFKQPLDRDFSGTHIAWSQDLGQFPVDKRITKTIEKQKNIFESIGCMIIDDQPDFTDADEIFKIWRAWQFELAYAGLLETHRDQIKDTVVWNIEEGQKLSGSQIGQAEIKRTKLYHRIREFMGEIEFLVLPVSQVPPFDIKQRYITEINGTEMETYIDWMKSCYYISVTGLPAISVPCGFTSEGLPVGIQIVGRHQDDFGVLQLAYAFEQSTGFWKRKPAIVE